jgi:O-acetyl-ADP-ribose deacetylase (regulator of RNase III)
MLVKIVSEIKLSDKILRLVLGDITSRKVDAIVNAANSRLHHGGGVAGAIVRKGGQIIQDESDKIGYIQVGHAAITTAGKLPARYIIHAVGPRMGEGDEDSKLENAVLSSLMLASEKGFKSISFPAISSGIFGFPKDRCAGILVYQVLKFLQMNQGSSLQVVEFCIFDEETLEHFRREFDKIKLYWRWDSTVVVQLIRNQL